MLFKLENQIGKRVIDYGFGGKSLIMDKQNQFIVHKAGLGLSITLVLVNQLAAQAGTASDKTQWLTKSIGQAKQSNATITLQPLSAREDTQEKSSISDAADTPKYNVKMRPFIPNRRLPSRRDLEAALIEQKAKLAEENNARLNGQISTFVVGAESQNSPASTYNSSIYNRNFISRNYVKQSTPKSRQANFSFMKQAEQHLLSTSMPQPNQQTNISTTPNSVPTMPLAALAPTVPIPSPTIMNQLMVNPSIDAYSPTMSLAQPSYGTLNNQTNSGFGSAGPPPFPLNLVPEATLKQLIRSLAGGGSSRFSNAPRAAFGSWHSNASYNNLSYGGFQTHLANRSLPPSNIKTYRISALPAVTGSPIRSNIRQQKSQNISNQKDTAARNRMLIESQIRVATYPTYTTQSLRPWNFAQ